MHYTVPQGRFSFGFHLGHFIFFCGAVVTVELSNLLPQPEAC